MEAKKFLKKMSWWKKLVLLVLIVVVVVVVWKIVHKPYYMEDGLCYSDFLENCEGKKVEITGEIMEGLCGKSDYIKSYFLCKINILPCNPSFYQMACSQASYCLGLVQPCNEEDDSVRINYEIERLLPDPNNTFVEIIGIVFVLKPGPYSSVGGRFIGIVPESITAIKDEK